MDNTLTIQLFLLGFAVPIALEAYKATKPSRWILWTFCGIFFSSGLTFPWLLVAQPQLTEVIRSVVGSPASWVTLSVGLFFVLRPYWQSEPEVFMNSPILAASYDDSQLRSEIASLSKTVRAVTEDYQRMSVSYASLVERMDDRFDKTWTQIAIQAGEHAGFKEETEKRLLGNDYAFSAIGHREILLARASELQQGSDILDLEARGGSLTTNGAWKDWTKDYKKWRGDLEDWLILASPYWLEIQSVKKLPDNIHKLSWTFGDSQFPNSAAIHEYRSFCVVHHNWLEIKDKVHAAVRKVAFEGALPVNAEV